MEIMERLNHGDHNTRYLTEKGEEHLTGARKSEEGAPAGSVDREQEPRVPPTNEMPTPITSEFNRNGDEQKVRARSFTGSKNERSSSLSNNGGESPKKGFYSKPSPQNCGEASRGSEVSILVPKVKELVANRG